LLCRPSDGKWVLSEDTQSHTVAEGPGNHALVHLEWSETGGELAVVDAGGRVSVFSISIALNNIALHRQAILDQADDGGQVVGMLWLNTQRSVGPSTKQYSLDEQRILWTR
jgi:mediator of RNA polymerase II transcription subunit 16